MTQPFSASVSSRTLWWNAASRSSNPVRETSGRSSPKGGPGLDHESPGAIRPFARRLCK